MRVSVGSLNPTKFKASSLALQEWFPDTSFTFSVREVSSHVVEQPLSLKDTVIGATNRARTAFTECELSVGLEGGVYQLPELPHYFQICVAVLFVGEDTFTGFSPSFALPEEVGEILVRDKVNLNDALQQAGFTNNPAIGLAEGAVGLLSSNRIVRLEYMKQALNMALIPADPILAPLLRARTGACP